MDLSVECSHSRKPEWYYGYSYYNIACDTVTYSVFPLCLLHRVIRWVTFQWYRLLRNPMECGWYRRLYEELDRRADKRWKRYYKNKIEQIIRKHEWGDERVSQARRLSGAGPERRFESDRLHQTFPGSLIGKAPGC
ncbi:hypothetical protein LCGC14_1923170 [marine sediment metagenome]|uniref:Uncharacterized protein n=1 Tax=marine sediment metagenome TaxID=412755 RepID=A0A0F9GDK2_9ZZZZ